VKISYSLLRLLISKDINTQKDTKKQSKILLEVLKMTNGGAPIAKLRLVGGNKILSGEDDYNSLMDTIYGVNAVFEGAEKDKKNPLYELFKGGIDEKLRTVGTEVWGVKPNFAYVKFYKDDKLVEELTKNRITVLSRLAAIQKYEKMHEDWFFGFKTDAAQLKQDLAFSIAFLSHYFHRRGEADDKYVPKTLDDRLWCWGPTKDIIETLASKSFTAGYTALSGDRFTRYRTLLDTLRRYQLDYGESRDEELLKGRPVDDDVYKMASYCYLRLLNELRQKREFRAVMKHYKNLVDIITQFIKKNERVIVQQIANRVGEEDSVKLKKYGTKYLKKTYDDLGLEKEAKRTLRYLDAVLQVMKNQHENTAILQEKIVENYLAEAVDWSSFKKTKKGDEKYTKEEAQKMVTQLTQTLVRDSLYPWFELIGSMKLVTMLSYKVITHLDGIAST